MDIVEARRLLKELKDLRDTADGSAFRRLQDKARWEHMTLLAVLLDWGDPRKWPK